MSAKGNTLHFGDRLCEAVTKRGNPCVMGLDPRPEHFPESLRPATLDPKENAKAILRFNKALIDLAASFIPAVKPQIAFYERFGSAGYGAYEETIAYAHQKNLLVIGDAKRGDIGSTAEAYALAHLGAGEECADALTVNPLFGSDGVAPFLKQAQKNGKGLFFLVQTSNPSACEIQGQVLKSGESVSEKIAELVNGWGSSMRGTRGYSSVGAVVGATQSQSLKSLRKKLPHSWLLLPGYGAQGGKAQDLSAAFDSQKLGGLVTSSRGILNAYQEEKYVAEKSWTAACEKALRDMVQDVTKALSAH